MIWVQHVLPGRPLSRAVFHATRWRWRPWKRALISRIVAAYDVDMTEAAEPDVEQYESFNAFFTRALKPGARIADPDLRAVLMPADGKISQLGAIRDGRIFQAKGHDFSVAELLGDAELGRSFANGSFATVYLSPRDYHRVHMPLTGTLTETIHVPGRLFTVAPAGVEGIPGLFARNERVACLFDTDIGPMAVVMVAAMLVSGVETVWRGVEIPPYARRIIRRDYRGRGIRLERFAEMARFNMGSTVVVLFPTGAVTLDEALGPQQPVRLGQRLGRAAEATALR